MIHRLILFVVILTLGIGLETWDLDHTQYQAPWNAALAFLAEKSILLFKGVVTRAGNQLSDPVTNKSVLVLGGCNGFEATFILMTAMLIYPSCMKAKAIGISVGVLAVQTLNVVRIICLYFLNIWDEEMFRFAHLYFWQSLIMLDVMGVLFIWLRWQRGACRWA